MFKKNRNALLEEMRAIARQENGEVIDRLAEAGVLSEETAVVGFDGQRFVSYGTRLVTEAKAREIANEEIDKAQWQQASAHEEDNGNAGATEFTLYSEGGFVLSSLVSVFEDEVHAERGCRRDEKDDSRCAAILSGVDSVITTDAAFNAALDLLVGFLNELRRPMNGCAVAGEAANHNSSPVVAESGAVTPDAPAMTVQENTGAGAVSPSVPAQPRFVQLGASVYDRRHDRFLVAVNEAGAESIVDELNEHQTRVVDFNWEDAK